MIAAVTPPHTAPFTRADRAYEAFGSAAGDVEAVRGGWHSEPSWWSSSHLETAVQNVAVGQRYLDDIRATPELRADIHDALVGARALGDCFRDGQKDGSSASVDRRLDAWSATLRVAQSQFTRSPA